MLQEKVDLSLQMVKYSDEHSNMIEIDIYTDLSDVFKATTKREFISSPLIACHNTHIAENLENISYGTFSMVREFTMFCTDIFSTLRQICVVTYSESSVTKLGHSKL